MNSRSLLFIFLLLFYVLVSINSFAAKISGKVTDANDQSALTGVTVNIKNTPVATQTDIDGNYVLDGLESGSYEIVFSYITYIQQVQTIRVRNNQDVVLDVKLKPDGKELQEVNVRTNRITNTENATIMEVKNSNVIVSAISAGQIAKTMDRNAGDVIKRVPGVTIKDDRFIVVRGLADRYNTVWLNDASAPSSEADKKSFSFDILPSGLIDRMLVYKTPSPELPGDFAGGMVKIYTKSIPDRNEYSVSVQTSYRKGSTGTQFNYNEPSKTDWLGYDDGGRNLPANTPDYVNKADSNNEAVTRSFKNDWLIKTKTQSPDIRFNLAAANVFNIKNAKLGNTFGASYSNVFTNYQIDRKAWDSSDSYLYHNLDLQSATNVNVALINNTAVNIGNSKIEFKNLYNQIGKSTVTYRTNVPDTAATAVADERAYQINYESRAVYFAQLAGSHNSRSENRKYNWTIGYTDLFKNQPSVRRLKYAKQTAEDDSMYKAGIANVVDPFNGGGRVYFKLFEHIYSFNHQFLQKINLGGKYSFEVSAGNFIEYKTRIFYIRQLGYVIRPSAYADGLKRMRIGEIFSDSNVGGPGKFQIDEGTLASDKYSGSNELIASFLSLKLPIGNRVNILGGVRHEYNKQGVVGYTTQDTLTPSVITRYFLPSVNITYNFNEKALLRLAYGKTLNRPEFREWAPIYYYDFDERSDNYGSLYGSVLGTEILKVAEIQNVDVRWEYYPATGEMIHVGGYYKKFKNPIQMLMVGEADTRKFTFTNTESAWCVGGEVEVRKKLDFIDEWINTRVFRDFAIVGNATLIKSEMTIGNKDTANQVGKTQLQGQSPYMYNLGLFYQNDMLGIQSSALYNVYGPRMYALGTVSTPSLADMPFHSLDFFLSKTFYKHYNLNIGIQNILDQSIVQTQDVSGNKIFETKYDADPNTSNDKQIMSYKPGRYYTVGIRIKL